MLLSQWAGNLICGAASLFNNVLRVECGECWWSYMMLSRTVSSETARVAAVCEHQDKSEFTGLIVNASMTRRPVSVTAEENLLAVAQTVDQTWWQLIWKAVTEPAFSSREVHRSGFHCYIPGLVYILLQSDHKLKVEIFCTVLQWVLLFFVKWWKEYGLRKQISNCLVVLTATAVVTGMLLIPTCHWHCFQTTRVFNWCAVPCFCVLGSILSWLNANEWVILANATIAYCNKTLEIACQQFQRFLLQPVAVAYCAAKQTSLGRVSVRCLWFC